MKHYVLTRKLTKEFPNGDISIKKVHDYEIDYEFALEGAIVSWYSFKDEFSINPPCVRTLSFHTLEDEKNFNHDQEMFYTKHPKTIKRLIELLKEHVNKVSHKQE